MRDLKTLREGWVERAKEEAKLPSNSAVQERVEHFFAMYQTFAPRLEETETIFGPQRRAHLAEIQRRLQRLAEWQQTHAG